MRFLAFMLEERGEQYLFNLVHQAIGNRLSSEAARLGYEQDKSSGIKEWNIWGDETNCVVYRRTSQVKHP